MQEQTIKDFWSRVDKTNDCWNWKGTLLNGVGTYGRFHHKGQYIYAHRLSYELSKGEIPEGLSIDHLCRNRQCVNPNHLETVTHKENMLRGYGVGGKGARQTHCKNGHPLSGDNLLILNKDKGWRRCRTCLKVYNKKYLDNKK